MRARPMCDGVVLARAGTHGQTLGANRLDRAIQLRLRTLVGFLGERQQSDWWSSSSFSPASKGFITPIFGKDHHSAQLIGVTETARRVHDALIGVG